VIDWDIVGAASGGYEQKKCKSIISPSNDPWNLALYMCSNS